MPTIEGPLRAGVAAFALAIGTVCSASPASAQGGITLPAASLEDSLNALSRQSGTQILADQTLLRGKRAQPIRRAVSVEIALAQLLRGSGLTWQKRGDAFLIIRVRPDAAEEKMKRGASSVAAAAPSEAPAADAADIIVTGTRGRISPAPQAQKKNAIGFVSSVGTEELDKRTDLTVVSALERLPGVSRQRGTYTSQAWYPALRGIPAWYNSVSLDGDLLYLSTRNQRGTPLDFIPNSIINEIVIDKTVTPEMDPNSIGGHVEVRTLRAFDNDSKPLTSLDIQAVNYSQPGATKNANPSYNISGVIKRTFGTDGNFGYVLAGSVHKDQYNEIYNTTSSLVQQNGIDIPSGAIQNGNYNTTDRGFNLMGKLEGRGDKWYGYLIANYFYDRLWRDAYRSNLSIVPSLTIPTGDGAGSFANATPFASPSNYYNNRDIVTIRGGVEYQTNDTSKFIASGEYLNVKYREGLWTGGNIAAPTVSGTYNISSTVPSAVISNSAALDDPTQWVQKSGTTSVDLDEPLTTEIAVARLEYKSNDFHFSRGFGYDFGVDFRQMWRKLSQVQINYTLPVGTTLNLSQVLADGVTFNGANPNVPVYVSRDKYWNLVRSIATRTVVPTPTADYDLSEQIISPYAALYYTTDKFRVIAGARYHIVHYTNTTATVDVNGRVAPFHVDRTTPLLLPNVQGYYNVTDNFRVRAAYTETMALQNYSSYLTGIATNTDGKGIRFTQGSNPYLKPRHSYNEDVSLEWYLQKGYFSLGWFRKTITNEVQNTTQYTYDSSGVLTTYSVTPVNAGGEHTQGIEFEAQWRDFTGLAPWLKGLSVDANAVWFHSDTEALVGAGVERKLPYFAYQPKYLMNLILTYQRGPFSASILGHASGKALNLLSTVPANDVYIAPYQTLDLMAGYQLNRNLKLYFEGKNLTNYWYKELWGIDQNLVSTANRSGAIYTVGAKLNF